MGIRMAISFEVFSFLLESMIPISAKSCRMPESDGEGAGVGGASRFLGDSTCKKVLSRMASAKVLRCSSQ